LAEELVENWVQVFSLAEVQPKMEGRRVSKSKPKVQCGILGPFPA
jgi:hypothetical protein